MFGEVNQRAAGSPIDKPISEDAKEVADRVGICSTALALPANRLCKIRFEQIARRSWWGSHTGRLQKMLNFVRYWLLDENETVRNWASEIAEDIEATIRQEKPCEDEDDLLYR